MCHDSLFAVVDAGDATLDGLEERVDSRFDDRHRRQRPRIDQAIDAIIEVVGAPRVLLVMNFHPIDNYELSKQGAHCYQTRRGAPSSKAR
ncbi:MAG: hypothetical protein ACI9KE_003173 [Polyangiales bacterium]|jgi:hypothetical protein